MPASKSEGKGLYGEYAGKHLNAYERGLLRLVAQGLTNQEIGHLLGRSGATVKRRLAIIADKVGVGDRTVLSVQLVLSDFDKILEAFFEQHSSIGMLIADIETTISKWSSVDIDRALLKD